MTSRSPDNDNKSAMAFVAGLSHLTCPHCGYKGTILDRLIPFGKDGKPLGEPTACSVCFSTEEPLFDDDVPETRT